MTRYLVLLTILFVLGCDDSKVGRETARPKAYIESEHRVGNYVRYRQGSCLWACAATIANDQGRPKLAAWLTRNFHSGENEADFKRRMKQYGVEVATHHRKDLSWLRRAFDNGYACGVGYTPRDRYRVGLHEQVAYRMDSKYIYILDPNDTEPRGVPIGKFLRYWDGNAFALPYEKKGPRQ